MPCRMPALLLVGGGRWSRVYLSVLSHLAAAPGRIVVVSRHGGRLLAEAAANASADGTREIEVVASLDDAVCDAPAVGAIVANAARDHVATALALLERRIPVLLEKPVALDRSDADLLVAAARRSATALVPGLVLQHCVYLHNFAAAARAMLGAVHRIAVEWADPAAEWRYDEIKGFDAGLGVTEEIGPHIWTLLAALNGEAAGPMAEVEFRNGGLAVRLSGASGSVEIDATLERQGGRRKRCVSVTDRDGRMAALDFSTEPGLIAVGDKQWDADPDWPRRPRPLTQQIERFLQCARQPPAERDLAAAVHSTRFVAAAAALVRQAQRSWLASPAAKRAPAAERGIAVRELLAPLLTKAGMLEAGDDVRLEALTAVAMAFLAGGQDPAATPQLRAVLASGVLPGTL
jgi:predicted dehydrogenase